MAIIKNPIAIAMLMSIYSNFYNKNYNNDGNTDNLNRIKANVFL